MTSYEEFLNAMKEEYRSRSGSEIHSDSDVGIRMQVLASQLHALSSNIDWLSLQMFPQTAWDTYLDLHAAQYGLVRKAAVPAVGKVRFSVGEAVWYDIEIPAETVCSTQGAQPLRFLTDEDAVLRAGQTEVTVKAVSEQGGESYNVSAEKIDVIVNPAQAFLKVRNPVSFSGGSDGENDRLLRERIADVCGRKSNGTNAAFYENEALQYEGVVSAVAIPRANGRGTVDLYLAASGGPSSGAVIEAVAADLEKKREIGVDVKVLAARIQNVDVVIKVTPQNGYTLDDLTPVIERQIGAYFLNLKIGENILLADLGNLIYNIDGVANYRIENPTDDCIVPPNYLMVCQTVSVGSF